MKLALKRPLSMTYILECSDEAGKVIYRLKRSGVLQVRLLLLDAQDQEVIRMENVKGGFSPEMSFLYGDQEFMRLIGRRKMVSLSAVIEGADWTLQSHRNVLHMDILEKERIIASLSPVGTGFLAKSELVIERKEDLLPALAVVCATLYLRKAFG